MKILLERWQQFLKEDSTVVTVSIKGVPLELELAADEQSRNDGLMFRDALGENAGMLFMFPDSDERSFWMKDTDIPLSIAYLDELGTILNIEDMTPHDTTATSSEGPARCAIETNKGWFENNGISAGDLVEGLPL